MKHLTLFICVHSLLLFALLYREYCQSKKLYAVLLAVTQNNALHLFHTVFVMLNVFVASKFLISATLGHIRPIEMSSVNDNLFLFFTDILLVVTIFNDDLSIQNLVVFIFLIALKAMNWVVSERIKQFVNTGTYAMCAILFVFSFFCSFASLHNALAKPSLYILFAFEFGIIALACLHNLFFSYVQDKPNRTGFTFLIDICYIFCKLVAITSFFLFTAINFRIPFNLFREALSTLKMLYKKIHTYIQYRRISKELEKCEKVRGGGSCPICYTDMEEGRKISCGHVFHMECLKTWVETSEICPICRREMFKNLENVYTVGSERITGIPVVFDE